MLYLGLTQTKKTWSHLFKHQKYNQLLSELFLYAPLPYSYIAQYF